jgi:hypothetical protein
MTDGTVAEGEAARILAGVLPPQEDIVKLGDGRELMITGWHPHIVHNNILGVTIEAHIRIPPC